jgi:DNA primase
MDLFELLQRDTSLKRVASTHGGEYAGACPWCGGSDRFRVWPNQAHPRYWCRGCGKRGDAIDYLRDHDGLTYRQATRFLKGETGDEPAPAPAPTSIPAQSQRQAATQARQTPGKGQPSRQSKPFKPAQPREPDGSPPFPWQLTAIVVCHAGMKCLWSEEGKVALDYLRSRGLRDETIKQANLGYLPRDAYHKPEEWAFASNDRPVWLPAGILIPWYWYKHMWAVRIRSLAARASHRYILVRGSANTLYGGHAIHPGKPVVLVEGELDALTIWQEASDLALPVANGSTAGARTTASIARLARANLILLAFDADAAGEQAAAWWQSRLPTARRWQPCWKDPNAMLQSKADVRAWVEQGITYLQE